MTDLKAHYQKLYQQHGANHNAVQHVSKASQQIRFAIFHSLIKNSDSVIDLGCGLGDMLIYLREKGFKGRYLGCDFVPEFISFAKQAYSDDKHAEFVEFDIFKDKLPNDFEHILISGIFNNKMADNFTFLSDTLAMSFRACRHSVIFNALSDFVEFQDPELYYISPLEIFEHCKLHLTPYVLLKHDYVTKQGGFPYEFTMQLSKQADLIDL